MMTKYVVYYPQQAVDGLCRIANVGHCPAKVADKQGFTAKGAKSLAVANDVGQDTHDIDMATGKPVKKTAAAVAKIKKDRKDYEEKKVEIDPERAWVRYKRLKKFAKNLCDELAKHGITIDPKKLEVED